MSYSKDVVPIFVASCVGCHTPEKMKGKLDMTTYANLMKGGKEGKEIEPGHELWKYSYKETKEGDGYVFLIFAGSDKNVTGGNVFVEFKNDVVSKSWRG